MHDLHSNSGAIKLNQTGGMLKHLRTSSTIDNMHCGLGSQQRSLESQRSMAPGLSCMDPSQLKQAFYFSDPVPLFLVYTAFYFSDPVPLFLDLVQDHFSYK